MFSEINIAHEHIIKKQKVLKGIPSSPGLALNNVFLLKPEIQSQKEERIQEIQIESEISRLDNAINELTNEFENILKKVRTETPDVASVLESNLMILTDEYFIKTIKEHIKERYSVEYSIILEFDRQSRFLFKAKDQLLRERAFELEQTKERLLSILRNKCILYSASKDCIVVAKSLTPTDIINFHESGAVGFITEVGGITAHASILARNFSVPMIIGVSRATSLIDTESEIILDGYTGEIVINPNEDSILDYHLKKQVEEENEKELGEYKTLESKTSDGKPIKLLANIDLPADVDNAVMFGAEGIGLVRSEHLIISLNRIPNEVEQYEWYKSIAERAYPNPVAIRVFDIGSDKFSVGLTKHEDNPALGFRGIRYLLNREETFKTQLRAIFRASKNKNVKIMLPMITCYEQVQKSIFIINQVKEEFIEKSIHYDKDIKIGVMIETPAAAIISEKIAELVDFFSIGTNDLTQYTLAVDRTNEFVSQLYDSFHPSVLMLIKKTAEAANKSKIPVSICGEFAAHPAATKLLIGLGIDELSVSPPSLLELKKRIRENNFIKSKKFVDEILTISECDSIREKLSIQNEK